MGAQRGGFTRGHPRTRKIAENPQARENMKKYGNNAENEGEALKEAYQRNRVRRDKAERRSLFNNEKKKEERCATRKQQT